jgi:hypothetical protein
MLTHKISTLLQFLFGTLLASVPIALDVSSLYSQLGRLQLVVLARPPDQGIAPMRQIQSDEREKRKRQPLWFY